MPCEGPPYHGATCALASGADLTFDLAKRAAELDTKRRAGGWLPEIERIQALPRSLNTEAAGLALVTPWTEQWALPGKVHDLRPIQAVALATLAGQPAPLGLFGVIAVGWGKTLITLLAGRACKAERPVILMHPDLEPQFWRDVFFWQKQYDLKIPTVVTYSRLSQPDGGEILDRLNPDLVIVDECQALRHSTSARTKRVLRFARSHPDTRWVMLSGTTTSKSLDDYAHLMEMALRHTSPLPLRRYDLELWCAVVDVKGSPDKTAIAAIAPLVKSEGLNAGTFAMMDEVARRALCRKAVHLRQSTAPGVVSTETMSLNAPLILTEFCPPPVAVITEALRVLHSTWTRPDGEELANAAQLHAVARQLSSGFYYKWEWPDGIIDEEWLEARGEWQRQVRHAIRYASARGHDSPLLISNRCKRASEGRGRVPIERLEAWEAWQLVKGRDAPPRSAVWLTDVIMNDVADWVKDHPRALLWYMSDAVGEALRAKGIPVFGRGSDVPPNDLDVAACSIYVHGKGKNLQAWADQLMIEVPSSGQIMEQLLGRTHRQGQEATKVRASYMAHTEALRRSMRSARVDSEYIEATQGTPQKLNACKWSFNVPSWLCDTI